MCINIFCTDVGRGKQELGAEIGFGADTTMVTNLACHLTVNMLFLHLKKLLLRDFFQENVLFKCLCQCLLFILRLP